MNVAYYLQRYYSRYLNKVFEVELPEDVKGSQFGAGLKSTVAYLHYKTPMIRSLMPEGCKTGYLLLLHDFKMNTPQLAAVGMVK